jgi:SAM-dependent methyltransferase
VKLGRRASLWINDALDRYVPPVWRDSRLFGALARRMYGPLTVDITEFKTRAFSMTRAQYVAFYQGLRSNFDQGATDLTPASLHAVLGAVRGRRVLDVACGLGHLAGRLASSGRHVVGCDLAAAAGRAGPPRQVTWIAADIEALPFRDGAFDTVTSTHTLEHVPHLARALAEIRRVARERIVIVVPRQRPYRITFNPHLHFFPYDFSVLAWTGTERAYSLDLVGGDWLYIEDQPSRGDHAP